MSEEFTRPDPGPSVSTPALGSGADTSLTVGVFDNFRSGVIDLDEPGDELLVTREVWVSEEIVVTTQVIERTALIRDVLRRVDVDVEPLPGQRRDPL